MSDTTHPVLIIEDNYLLADLLGAVLESAGWATIRAADGAEGLALARAASPALILCDMWMPGLNGAEVCQALRDDPATAQLPFVLMSGEAAGNLAALGADAFLAKPFSSETVLCLLNSLAVVPPEMLAA